MFENIEHDGREKFHSTIHYNDSGLPADFEIVDETAYSENPVFVSEWNNNERARLRVSFKNDSPDSNTRILTTVESELQSSFEFDLKYEWEFETPSNAGIGLLQEVIPKMRKEL